MTRSPFWKLETAVPKATTIPVPSWEAMQGSLVPKPPAVTMESVWQREAAAVLRRIS